MSNVLFAVVLRTLVGGAVLCGAAGLIFLPLAGSKAIVRHDYRLLRRAGYLFVGCALFLIVAGILEGIMLAISLRW